MVRLIKFTFSLIPSLLSEPKKQPGNGCFSTSSVNITQPIYRKTSNTAIYPATIAGFNGVLGMGRRPQHHRSTGPRMNQLRQSNTNSTLPRNAKSSSIGRQDATTTTQKKQVDRKAAADSGFSSGSGGYLSASPPGGSSFMLGSY
jgi:hypothetical protein